MKALLKLVRTQPIWAVASIYILLSGAYWGVLATDRYVSEATIVLDSPKRAAPSLSFSTLLTGGGNTQDLLLLREHLLSVDMTLKLQQALDIKNHYSQSQIDWWSRLAPDAHIEAFHKFMSKFIQVEIDEYSSVLRVHVEAFEPEFAQKMASFLLSAGEDHMNTMGQNLAQGQVSFMEQQVQLMSDRVDTSRAQLLQYQNSNGQISPASTVEALSRVIGVLEAELSQLKAKRHIARAYLSEASAEMIKLNSEIQALETQIAEQQARMATRSGEALNAVTAAYATLERQLKFNIEMYGNALAALENTRVEAARTLKQISILQAPSLAEYSVQPRRLYQFTTALVLTLVITLTLQMLVGLIKEHRD